jgi:hypothetical protein
MEVVLRIRKLTHVLVIISKKLPQLANFHPISFANLEGTIVHNWK